MLLWLFPDCLLGRWPVALGFLMAGPEAGQRPGPSCRAAAHPPSAPQAVRKSGRAQGIPLGQGVLLGWQEENQVAPTWPQGVVNPGVAWGTWRDCHGGQGTGSWAPNLHTTNPEV